MENTPFWIGSPSSRIEAAENSNKKHATRSNPLNLLVEGSRTKRSYRNGYGVSGSETLVWRFLNSWLPLEGREREGGSCWKDELELWERRLGGCLICCWVARRIPKLRFGGRRSGSVWRKRGKSKFWLECVIAVHVSLAGCVIYWIPPDGNLFEGQKYNAAALLQNRMCPSF